MKPLNALAQRIVPVPSPHVRIAYGDWATTPTPVTGSVKTLKSQLSDDVCTNP